MLLDNKTALQHIPGCVQCTGLNATVKHNRVEVAEWQELKV